MTADYNTLVIRVNIVEELGLIEFVNEKCSKCYLQQRHRPVCLAISGGVAPPSSPSLLSSECLTNICTHSHHSHYSQLLPAQICSNQGRRGKIFGNCCVVLSCYQIRHHTGGINSKLIFSITFLHQIVYRHRSCSFKVLSFIKVKSHKLKSQHKLIRINI